MEVQSTAAGTALTGDQVEAKESIDETLDQFLMMLTTQLQHQDPLDPLDTAEFTNQLVGFSTVEQLIAQNQKLDDLIAAQTTSPMQTALGYIGLEVEVQGSGFGYDGQPVTMAYTLDSNAVLTTVSVVDVAGDTVWSSTGETAPGFHELTWDGLDNDGNPVDPGQYFLQVEAADVDGGAVAAVPYVRGQVTGVETDGSDVLLKVGDLYVSMDSVLAVHLPPQASDPSA